jgi:hypothetical protein
MSMVIGNLRNVDAVESVKRSEVRAVFAYHSDTEVNAGIDGLIRVGILEAIGEDCVRLSPLGADMMVKIHSQSDEAANDLWSAQPQVAMLNALAGRALERARIDGGVAFSVMAPRVDLTGTDAGVLAERLTGLRFHRFDSHVAAWQRAGLTANEAKQLAPGKERDAIEADTNLRAATPFTVLSSDERLDFIGGLAALRG